MQKMIDHVFYLFSPSEGACSRAENNLCDGNTTDFPINIGLHQGSALNPYLFALVMDEVTSDIQGEIHGVCSLLMMWC